MHKSNRQILSKLIVFVKPMLPVMVIAIAMGTIGFLAAILIPVLGAQGVVHIMEGRTLRTIVIAMAACAVLRGVLRYAEQACNHYIAFRLLAHIRDLVFGKLRALSCAKLEGRDKGNFISLITSDVELLEVFYAHTISPVCIALLVSAICVAWQASMHGVLAFIALAGYATVGIGIPFWLSKTSAKAGKAFREQAGAQNAMVLESVRGMKELLWFQAANRRKEQILQSTKELASKEKKIKQGMAKGVSATNVCVIAFTVLTLLASMALARQGMVVSDVVLMAPMLMISSFGPVIALSNLGTGLAQTLGAGERLLDLLEEEAAMEEVEDGADAAFGSIAVENVYFAYGKERVLQNFSTQIPKNRILGIQGKSGCGKSTLLKLLMRMWDVDEGRILIDEKSIQGINTRSLRRHESYVAQETVLFHDSIARNLRIAKADASDEELVAACKKASIHDFIMSLPQGYDTPVAELGSSVSGGERQRLGLARAFLHDGDVLLLDEPTSNLDSLNEGAILKAVDENKAGKTIVLVSHRTSSLQFADTILKMEKT